MATLAQTTTAPNNAVDRATFVGTEGAYMLPHHAKEIERLQRQHRFMFSSTGGDLLRVPLPDASQKIKVLDCGCADGTLRLFRSCGLLLDDRRHNSVR